MNTLETFVEKTKSGFAALDRNIGQLEKRACELREGLAEVDGYTLSDVKKTAAARGELARVEETLQRARAERQRRSTALAEGLRQRLWTLREEYASRVRDAHAGQVAEIAALSACLRRAVWQLARDNETATLGFNDALTALSPYLDEAGRRELWSCRTTGDARLLSPHTEHNGPDYDLIRFVEKAARRYRF